MATNYVQEGVTLDLLAPYDRTSGQGFQVGQLFAVALGTALSGAAVRGMTSGVWTLTKVGSQAWAVGDRIYWDNTNKRCTTDATAGILIGVATAIVASGSGDVTGNVRLNGVVPDASEGENLDFSALVPGSETYGSIMTTKSNWIAFPTAGAAGMKLLLENTSDTGEFATLRMRARANNTTVSGNGGNSVGTTTCIDASASAQDHEYGNLKAVNAVAQPNALNQTVDATNIVTALYGRIDATGTSIGRRWVGWLDTHATTKASGGDYMQRISHNGTVANDGCFTIYNGGRMPVLFNFEDAAGFLTDTGSPGSTAAGYIAVQTPAGTKYISLFTA